MTRRTRTDLDNPTPYESDVAAVREPHGYPVNHDDTTGMDQCPVCHQWFLPVHFAEHMETHLGPPEGDVTGAEPAECQDPDKLGRVPVPIPGGGVLWVPPEFANDIKFIDLPTPPEPELPDPVATIEALFTRYDNELRAMRAERDQLNERIRIIVKLRDRLKSANATIRKP